MSQGKKAKHETCFFHSGMDSEMWVITKACGYNLSIIKYSLGTRNDNEKKKNKPRWSKQISLKINK